MSLLRWPLLAHPLHLSYDTRFSYSKCLIVKSMVVRWLFTLPLPCSSTHCPSSCPFCSLAAGTALVLDRPTLFTDYFFLFLLFNFSLFFFLSFVLVVSFSFFGGFFLVCFFLVLFLYCFFCPGFLCFLYWSYFLFFFLFLFIPINHLDLARHPPRCVGKSPGV